MLSLTRLIPCYNDAGTIASMVSSADEMAGELTDDRVHIGIRGVHGDRADVRDVL